MDLYCNVNLAYLFYRELCDIGDVGKLTRDQFALALYLINQKLSKGIDPPQTLSPEMIPPCDRLARQVQCSLNHMWRFKKKKNVFKCEKNSKRC